MAQKKIIYQIGFNVDNSNLKALETELNRIGNMSLKQLQIIDKNQTQQDLNEIKRDAEALGRALQDSYNPKIDSINLNKFNKSLNESGTNIQKLGASFQKVGESGIQSFRNLSAELLTAKKEIKQTSKLLDSMATTFSNTVKWSISSSVLNTFTGSIQKAWSYAQKLDTSLNDIRIVTGKSSDEMERFAKNANKAAKALGASTTNYTNAALIYYQQGLGETDVAARANVTVKAANVTGQSATEVSEQLTAVWNGYKVVAEEAELYVDKLAAVAATTAADLEELSTGMSKVASAASTMGVDIDQLSAQLSTIVSVTRQDANAVGTALKTIFARMGDLKIDGVDEFGVSLGDVSGQLQQMGINVLDQQGNLRDMGTVIEEVAAKWDTWTDAQQQAAAVAMAGKRQYNNLIALFENWDMYESALSTSKGAAGTLQKQQETYLDSLEAKFNKIGASAERVYDALFDSDSMKELLDGVAELVDGFGSFIESVGGGGNLLLMLGSIGARVFKNQIGEGLNNFIANLGVMKKNLDENKARLDVISQYKDFLKDPYGKDKDVISKMVAIREQELKYAKYLTEEEKAQLELNIKQTAELAKREDNIEDAYKKAQGFYKQNFGKEADENAERSSAKRDTATKAADKIRGKADEIYDEKEIHSLFARMEAAKKANLETKKGQDAINDAIKAEEEIRKRINELTSSNIALKEGQKSKLIELNKLASQGQLSEKEYADLMKEISEYYYDQADVLEQHKKILEDIKKSQENITNSNKTIFDSKNIKMFAHSMVETASATGSLASAWISLANIGKIWDNDSLSGAEKFQQTITSLVSSTGMLINGLQQGKKAFVGMAAAIGINDVGILKLLKSNAKLLITDKALDIEKTKAIAKRLIEAKAIDMTEKELEELNAEKLKETLLDKIKEKESSVKSDRELTFKNVGNFVKNNKAFAGFIKIAGIVAAVLIALGNIKKAFEKSEDIGKDFLESSNEGAATLAQSLENVRSRINDIQQSFSQLDEKNKTLDDLVIGTEEWQTALADVNNQVLELIDKYPELASEIETVNGQLIISAQAREELLEKENERLATAQRASLLAGNTVLTAQNNMTIKQGANEALGWDPFNNGSDLTQPAVMAGTSVSGIAAGAYLGGLLGTTVGPIGTAIGAVAGAVIGGVFGTVINDAIEKDQNEDYREAVDAVNKYGNTIFQSEAEFTEILQKETSLTKSQIKALWENKEELKNNSEKIDANTKALLVKQGVVVDDYLGRTSDTYSSSDEKTKAAIKNIIAEESVVTKEIASKRTVLGSSESEKLLSKYLAVDDWFFNKPFDTKIDTAAEVEALLKDYVATTGEEYATYDFDKKTQAITLKDAKGNVITSFSVGTALNTIANDSQMKEVATENNVVTIEENLKKLENKFGTGIYDFFANGNLSALNQSQFAAFANVTSVRDVEYLLKSRGIDIKSLGFDNAEDLFTAIQKNVSDYKTELQNITNTASNYGFSIDGFDQYSLNLQKKISTAFREAYRLAGKEGIGALNDLIANSDLTEEQINTILETFNSTDFTDSEAVSGLLNTLENLGIETDSLGESWDKFLNRVNSGTQQWINNTNKVLSNIAYIRDNIENVKMGDLVSDEEYKEMLKINPAVAKYFIKTAGGMIAIANGSEIGNTLKSQYKDVTGLKQYYTGVRNAVGTAEGDSGLTSQQLATATAIANHLSNNTDVAKIASALGLVGFEGNEVNDAGYLKTLLDRANNGDADAIEDLQNIVLAVNQAKLNNANGLYDDDAIAEEFATSLASSWDEARAAFTDTSSESYKKAKTYWENQLLQQLGYSSNIMNMSMTDLENSVIAMRELEKDYLTEISAKIEKLNVEADRLVGKRKVQALREGIQLAQDESTITSRQAEIAQKAFQNEISNNENIIDGEGNFDLDKFFEYYDTLTTDEDRATADKILEKYQKVLDLENQAIEAAYKIIDAQIEAFNYQIELTEKLLKFSRDMMQLDLDFSNFKDGFAAFEDSVVDRFNSLVTQFTWGAEDFNAIMDRVDNEYAKAMSSYAYASFISAGYDKLPELYQERDKLISQKKESDSRLAEIESPFGSVQKEYDENKKDTETKKGQLDEAQNALKTAKNEQKKRNEDLDYVLNLYHKAYAYSDIIEDPYRKISWAGASRTQVFSQAALDAWKENLPLNHEEFQYTFEDLISTLTGGTNDITRVVGAGERSLLIEFAQYFDTRLATSLKQVFAAWDEKVAADDDVVMAESKLATANNAYNTSLNATNKSQAEVDYYTEIYEEALENAFDDSSLTHVLEEIATTEAQYNAIVALVKRSYANPFIDAETGAFDMTAFTDAIEGDFEKAQEIVNSMKDTITEMYQLYLDSQKEILDLYNQQIDKVNKISNLIKGSINLSKIFGLETSEYYSNLTANAAASYDYANRAIKPLLVEYSKLIALENSGEKINNQMKDAVVNALAEAGEGAVAAAESWIQAVADEFEAKLTKAINDSLGEDVAKASEEWELALSLDDRTLDEVNTAYALNQLERKYQTSIDSMDSVTAQTKLRNVMREQLDILKEKDRLSQYEIDRANAVYELTLRQIALEEARQTANKMKLTRDAMGNYSYQYVVDEDQIAKAEEELAAAENNLYNLDKERNKSLVSEYYSTMTQANSQIVEAMRAGDTERAEALREHYFGPNGLLRAIGTELGIATENYEKMGEMLGKEDWISKYSEVSQQILNSDWNTLAASIEDIFNGEKGAVTIMQEIQTSVTSLLSGSNGLPAIQAVIQDSQLSAIELATKVGEIQGTTTALLATIPTYIEALNGENGVESFVGKLKEEMSEYETWYKNNVSSENLSQINALKSNTAQLLSTTAQIEILSENTEILQSAIANWKPNFDNGSGTEETNL